MTIVPPQTFDLDATYVHLKDGLEAAPLAVDDRFWAAIADRADLAEGRLVMLGHAARDWPAWERHPAGDELVYLLGGAVDLILEEPDGNRVIELRGRAACIVPRGIWHRAIVRTPGDLLHITPGAGTEHRPV